MNWGKLFHAKKRTFYFGFHTWKTLGSPHFEFKIDLYWFNSFNMSFRFWKKTFVIGFGFMEKINLKKSSKSNKGSVK
jgi:hypothetical protein